MSRDRWPELCESVKEDDGLPTWEVNPWTRDKVYFWHRYLEITTSAMVGNRKWPHGLAYVDLFAGSGVCTLKKSRERIPGSVLVAANTVKPFSRIIAVEKDSAYVAACRRRLAQTSVANKCHVLEGDCNKRIDEVVSLIPKGALTLAFIDPKGLDAQFTTVQKLADNARADLVILFADAYDINRNAEAYYRANPNSKLDQVLGPDSRWREELDALGHTTSVVRRKLFADIYRRQLKRHLGYVHSRDKVIKGESGPLYRLIYASKHELGVEFWEKALKKDSQGQRYLFD